MVGIERVRLSYVGGGVKADYEKLMTRYAREKSVRYEVFASIFKDMRMAEVFCLRQTDKECREFIEECFRLALKFTMSTYDLQTRVCALYILYSLYFKQICNPPTKIRVTSAQWQHLLLLWHEAREQRHLDVEYVFTRLRVERAFAFVAMPISLYPELDQRGEVTNKMSVAERDTQSSSSIVAEILQPENIDQVSAIHEQYHTMKCMLAGPSSTEPSEALNVIAPSLVQQITKVVASHEDRCKALVGRGGRRSRRDSAHTSESEFDSDSDVPTSPKRARTSESHGSRRAAIKDKAFKAAPVKRGGKGGRGSNRGRKRKIGSKPVEQTSIADVSTIEALLPESDPSMDDVTQTVQNMTSQNGDMLSMPILESITEVQSGLNNKKKVEPTLTSPRQHSQTPRLCNVAPPPKPKPNRKGKKNTDKTTPSDTKETTKKGKDKKNVTKAGKDSIDNADQAKQKGNEKDVHQENADTKPVGSVAKHTAQKKPNVAQSKSNPKTKEEPSERATVIAEIPEMNTTEIDKPKGKKTKSKAPDLSTSIESNTTEEDSVSITSSTPGNNRQNRRKSVRQSKKEKQATSSDNNESILLTPKIEKSQSDVYTTLKEYTGKDKSSSGENESATSTANLVLSQVRTRLRQSPRRLDAIVEKLNKRT